MRGFLRLGSLCLALSGGGFRATFYHLGVLAFLHERDLLPKIDHLCGISGGAIIAAHLFHNWEQYLDDPVKAAADLYRLVRMDLRGKIVGTPLVFWPGRTNRKLIHLLRKVAFHNTREPSG